ncbi:MAG: hypothetical protein ABSE27_05240 [Acidobacteriaceae bacterium]|jgi:hypothetical protein
MEDQSVFEPKMRSNGANSDPAPMACLSYATHLKKATRSVEQDVSHLCSAFLAERGCLSPGKSQKQTAA